MIWLASLLVVFLAGAGFVLLSRLRRARAENAAIDAHGPSEPVQRRRPLVIGELDTESPSALTGPVVPKLIYEDVSVVLRRQIPPRDEGPRSWLGGLPMLPDGVEWPRGVNPEKAEAGAVPLHFAAQIACADLPADLWGGLGPRQGWLLLFVNPNLSTNEDPGTWRILHTSELGAEREPPADIGPTHDGVYTGGSEWLIRPDRWRRWPVDLVAVPNELRVEEGRSLAAPDDFESLLYPEAEGFRDRRSLAAIEPYTWRCLLPGLQAAAASLAEPWRPDGRDAYRATFAEPENFACLLPTIDARIARIRGNFAASIRADCPPEEETADILASRERLANVLAQVSAERDALAQLLADHPDPQAVLTRIDADEAALQDWREEALGLVQSWCDAIGDHELDTPIDPAEVTGIRRLMEQQSIARWVLDSRYDDGLAAVGLRRVTLSLADFARESFPRATQEFTGDYYLDPARRHLVPPGVAEAMEPWWRSLAGNRPHRIGGYHDGLQSDATPGPQSRLLLLQLATDDAMQWCWGDAGAYYAFIAPADLAAGDFDKADLWLECH